MTAPDAEFLTLVSRAVRAERAAKVDSLGRDATLWLAAVPLWTARAAVAAGFPGWPLLDFVRRARDAGWCQTRGSLRDQEEDRELRFWMPDEHRRAVLDVLVRRGRIDRVLAEVADIAERVAGLSPATGARPGEGGITLPGALRVWADLALAAAPDAALVEAAARAVEDQDLSGAQELVSAGEALAALRAGTMELAVDRARRLLTLGMRRRQDGRALERYLRRPELSAAVTRLLAPDADRWALHLRGAGGVGKTMLIRYLAAGRFAADQESAAIPIARADFDHMSPDYPVRRPVQLLLELADELALHTAATSPADRALSRFRATAASVHESLSSLREERPAPMQNPRVLAAIDDFADAIGHLPGVLLILDTCEELAKADVGDPAAPAVRTTLAILERIHDRTPSVRVLFAGRRPLPARPYLDVADVAGFRLDEAWRYLVAFATTALPADLAEAMIRQSPAVEATGLAAGELPDRVSPFDLALYLAWADEDPGLDAERVARGSDAYIEGRIIERLRDPGVLNALPVLACAGRCRVRTIAAFLADDAAVLGPRLAEQEWIDAEGDPPLHVAAKPALAARLRHYFGAPDRAARFAAQTARLAGALREAVADAPLAEVDTGELLAALRLSDPADAARLWDSLADQAVAAERWNWLLNVTRRVLGESEEERWPTARALRATVLASYIAASRRASRSFDARSAWAEVRARADNHPDPQAGRMLLSRAAFGLLPYAPAAESIWALAWLGLEPPGSATRSLELAAAFADAMDRLLEAGAREAAARLLPQAPWLGTLAATSAPAELPGQDGARIRAWVLASAARLIADGDDIRTLVLIATIRLKVGGDDRDKSLAILAEAEAEIIRAEAVGTQAPEPDGGARPGLADWVPPDDLLARVRIERGLIAPPGEAELLTWESYAADRLGSADGERLASLCLRTRLGNGVIAPSTIEHWEETDRYTPDRVATCSAHDLVPPLFVTLAQAWLAAGYPQRALDLLERRRSAALDTRDDEATVLHADAETIRIVRRLRLGEQRAMLVRRAEAGERDPFRRAVRDSARRALAVVYWVPPPKDDAAGEISSRPESWHTNWQCQTDTSTHVRQPRWSASGTDTELAAAVELDLKEMRMLGHPSYQQTRDALVDWLASPRHARLRTADPYRDARADLRRAALAGDPGYTPPEVPPRLLAEMAFDEAELAGLRLPDAAARLFGSAYAAYASCDDLIGTALAALSRADITGDVSDLRIARAAIADLKAGLPDVGATLTGPVQEAGPWHYWTALQGRLKTDLRRFPRARVIAEVATRIADWAAGAFSACAAIGGVVLAVVLAYRADPAAFVIGVLGALGALLAAAAAAGALRPRSVAGVADARAVGAFGLGTLGFTALVADAAPSRDRVYLWAHLKPAELAPKRQWARLAVLTAATGLATALRRNAPNGYEGRFRASFRWETGAPEADAAWWSGGTAPGVMFINMADAATPWERIISASIGPDSAGRVEWYRLIGVAPREPKRGPTSVALEAPPRWRRLLDLYEREAGMWMPAQEASPEAAEPGVRIRHAMGRAVMTAAGPRLDISGEQAITSGAGELLGTGQLTRGNPSLLVLQAEPYAGDLADGGPDELPQMLALAVDVTQNRPGCDVLIVPALSAYLTMDVVDAIVEHASSPGRGSRVLQARLRQVLRPEVPPAVLDDLVLFFHARRPDRSRLIFWRRRT